MWAIKNTKLRHLQLLEISKRLLLEIVMYLVTTLLVLLLAKKLGISSKPNARKKILDIYYIYFANTIINFVEGFTRVEEHKTMTFMKMTTLLIASDKTINKGNNDILFKIIQLEMDVWRDVIISQEYIVAIFATILANGILPS